MESLRSIKGNASNQKHHHKMPLTGSPIEHSQGNNW